MLVTLLYCKERYLLYSTIKIKLLLIRNINMRFFHVNILVCEFVRVLNISYSYYKNYKTFSIHKAPKWKRVESVVDFSDSKGVYSI